MRDFYDIYILDQLHGNTLNRQTLYDAPVSYTHLDVYKRQAFRDWIWRDPERRQTLVRQYNEEMNSTRPRE